MGKVLFITGTDTGVGKTVLTALLLAHLRASGVDALAMKPFSSGSREDARLLWDLMDRQIPLKTVNPFHFRKPLAPLVAARAERRLVLCGDVTDRIRALQRRCAVLLVEGAGGVLTPLGEGYSICELINQVSSSVVLVTWNRIGVINHTLLSMRVLNACRTTSVSIALVGQKKPDISARTNRRILGEVLPGTSFFLVPRLCGDLGNELGIREHMKNIKNYLREISREVLSPPLSDSDGCRESEG
jgi:dethiobiotin synthetase